MCEQSDIRAKSIVNTMGLELSESSARHLRLAMKQMDLLLQARHTDTGLQHLVKLLQSLQTIRHEVD